MFFDSTYVLVIIGLIITLWAQSKVKTTFARYAGVASACGLTGKEVAEKILRANGIYGVSVQRVEGSLTDYYDPSKKTVCLSQDIYGSTSIAALGVAAHECGHAIQDDADYGPLRFRTMFVPIANIGSKLAWFFLIGGLLLSGLGTSSFAGNNLGGTVTDIGIIMFSLAVIFQLITLPVEFNASSRALKQLGELGILNKSENVNARKVLNAAAFTYVAAAASGVLSFLRILILFGGRGNRRR